MCERDTAGLLEVVCLMRTFFVLCLCLVSFFCSLDLSADAPAKSAHAHLQSVCDHLITTATGAAAAVVDCWYTLCEKKDENMPIKVELKEFIPLHHAQQSSTMNYFYAHGLAESYKQAYWYSKTTPKGTIHTPYLCDGRLFSFDFHDVTDRFWRVNFTQTSLAQINEIDVLRNAYDQAVDKLKNENALDINFILMGMSRGATSILNFMGMYKPEQVKAIIVESPFESTYAVTNNILSKWRLDKIPGMHGLQILFPIYKLSLNNKNENCVSKIISPKILL